MNPAPFLHVVAGVIRNAAGQVLLARRPDHLPHGGLWEFPGGKVERGETPAAALERELAEELGPEGLGAEPLLRVPYPYAGTPVLLDVWTINRYRGRPAAREGQALRWVDIADLGGYAFPEANRAVVTALRLPDTYLITPEPGPEAAWPGFLRRLGEVLAGGTRLVQLRAKTLSDAEYERLARQVLRQGREYGARILLNASAETVRRVGADGLHLSSERLRVAAERPLPEGYWVAASCHGAVELARAAGLPVDFAVLSPVQATASHPGATPLGWDGFQALAEESLIPVYALGGVGPGDVAAARSRGGQGIAAIRGLWGPEA